MMLEILVTLRCRRDFLTRLAEYYGGDSEHIFAFVRDQARDFRHCD